MISDISKKAEEYLDSAAELLCGLISYKSVMSEPLEGMPYGRGCAECMGFAEEVLRTDGFIVRNFGNHAVTADLFDGKAELGILCHLDVVPTEGQDWHTDPFKAEIKDGRIYGRGAIDDKGPAAAVITAMRIIRDSKIKLKRNVRLILGSNEENGSNDMRYYTSVESFPPMLFTPDGSFPVITAEKGMIRFSLTADGGHTGDKRLVSISGGSVINAVPERAMAVVTGFSANEISALARDILPKSILQNVTDEDNNTVCIELIGKGAHASTPALGENALTALIMLLSALGIGGGTERISRLFPCGEYDGASAGVKCSDERSGELTLVLSMAESKDGKAVFGADCRFPVGYTSADIISAITKKCGENGVSVNTSMISEPHYADEDSPMVRTLLSVYEDITGEKGRCLAIGGGTYVHDTENGVAFGAEWSEDNNMHGADEFIGLEELKRDIMIYTEAIIRICG